MKIIIILASGIGNSIMFSPTLYALKKSYPKAQIDIFAYKKSFAEPFFGSNLINNVIYYEGLSSIRLLRRKKYNLCITAFPSNKWQFNLFAFLIGAKSRLTHTYKVGNILSFLQNKKIPAEENLHDVENNLNLLKLLHINPPKKKDLLFFISKENKMFAQDFIKKNNLTNSFLIGIHPGSGPLSFKKAPKEKFLEKLHSFNKKNKAILIFGGPEEKQIKEDLANSLKEKKFIISASLKNTAALIKKCNLFITNDTGLMHIASTSKKTKVIALFNGTNPVRSRPYTNNAEVIILRKNKLKYPFHSTKAREE